MSCSLYIFPVYYLVNKNNKTKICLSKVNLLLQARIRPTAHARPPRLAVSRGCALSDLWRLFINALKLWHYSVLLVSLMFITSKGNKLLAWITFSKALKVNMHVWLFYSLASWRLIIVNKRTVICFRQWFMIQSYCVCELFFSYNRQTIFGEYFINVIKNNCSPYSNEILGVN